ncbi:tryptophanase [Desulfospira joergensenii]|uniref:tryptophanase n=1 Tax=Desulfospira joergensenii TaxID=53329 RepID=UPI0003B6E7ED|nr:tryptophanase [Desulfospira joergensenii]
MKTIIEPFRIKTTEPIKIISRKEREKALEKAHENVFLLDAEDCCIDLLTDSGTGAMSTRQWAAMMLGDESYAGSRSWKHFESTVQSITGIRHVLPTHQGRAAEAILTQTLIKKGDVIPNNSHFDTTRANIEYVGGIAENLLCEQGLDTADQSPFKGNMDIEKLEQCIAGYGRERIPFAMITVTNNSGGGQPVSMANIRAVKEVLDRHAIPLIIDACRFAENAYFIHEREKGYAGKSLLEISREMFSLADGATMSCKKDGLANIGGFLICNNDEWAEKFKNLLIIREGFPTYGGLAGRDLEAISVGLMEALEYDYQVYRQATVRYLSQKLVDMGVPIVRPAGGHAVFLDARKMLPDLPVLHYPGIGVINALYLEGGVRGVELGSVMFGRFDDQGREHPAPLELVRLAFPRRVYTQSHFDYLGEIIEEVWKNRGKIPGYRITYQSPFLRHFTCHFEKLAS